MHLCSIAIIVLLLVLQNCTKVPKIIHELEKSFHFIVEQKNDVLANHNSDRPSFETHFKLEQEGPNRHFTGTDGKKSKKTKRNKRKSENHKKERKKKHSRRGSSSRSSNSDNESCEHVKNDTFSGINCIENTQTSTSNA